MHEFLIYFKSSFPVMIAVHEWRKVMVLFEKFLKTTFNSKQLA